MLRDSQESKSQEEPQVGGRWSPEQHTRFLQAVMLHGKNWKLIQNIVETRTTAQVRSHAQKFFLKITKVEKERKKNSKKGVTTPSRNQEQLVKSLLDHALTPETPLEITRLLRKDPIPAGRRETERPPEDEEKGKSRSRQLLEEVLGAEREDSSFLASLMYRVQGCSRHNMNFLEREEAFTRLIDFPHEPREEPREEEETANKRKMSFTLFDEEEDPDKLQQTIKKTRGE